MRARTGAWNTRLRHLEAVLEQAEELSERVEQLWLRLWRHRPARGPQGERREKANRVVGPRMERKGKSSASFRVSRAVGVQKVRTREPLQEAAPGGRPGRLGDAVEAGAAVGSREASCFPEKLLFLMRPRGAGRAVAVEDSLSLILGSSCHQEGQAAGPERTPARKRWGPASDAVRQVLARP